MQQVAQKLGITIHAVTYALRKTRTPRRSFSEANRLLFESKAPSFKVRPNSQQSHDLNIMGAMLYWGEGYKRATANGVDFANSDPRMIFLFMRFLRNRYAFDSHRLYCSVYCYSDQHLENLVTFWSSLLDLPKANFKHHYVRNDFRSDSRKLAYGVLHIRYNDKKLLRDVLNLIESYSSRYCVGTQAVNEGRL